MNRRISVDLTLTIKDKSWPEDANEWKRRARQGNLSNIIVYKHPEKPAFINLLIICNHPLLQNSDCSFEILIFL